MATPDTITISGVTYNVYEAVAAADAYFAAAINATEWNDAKTNTKEKALVSATRLLDLLDWVGTIADADTPQPLQWPRTGVTNRKGVSVTFPQDILNGYYELAQELIANPTLADAANQDDNTKRIKVGEVESEFFRPETNTVRFPNQIHEWIKFYLASSTYSAGGFASGINNTTSFESGKYDRTEGYP